MAKYSILLSEARRQLFTGRPGPNLYLPPDPLNSLIARISTMDQGSSLLSELRQQCGDFFYGFDQNQLVRQVDPRSIN